MLVHVLMSVLMFPRAAKTLMVYLMETNANVYSWLVEFYKSNPIPKVCPSAPVSCRTYYSNACLQYFTPLIAAVHACIVFCNAAAV